MMNKLNQLLIILTAICFLSSCSASKKAHKQAKEYEKAGLYIQAAEYDLKALQKNSDYKEALVHLKGVAPKAYQEFLNRANNAKAAENWDQAVIEFQHLETFLQRLSQHGIVLETINVTQELDDTKHKAAETHFTNAESFYSNQNWQKAANAYLKAHGYIENYNGALEKAIESLIHSGDRFLSNKNFRRATKVYEKILAVAPNHRIATQKLAGSHYLWGKQYFKEGRYREALEQFQLTREYNPDYKDVAKLKQRAYENAVQFVGIFPFLNQTEFVVDGYFIAGEILGHVLNKNIEFVEFLDYADMVSLVTELRRNSPGRINEAKLLTVAEKEGLNSVVWGKVKDIDVRDKPESFHEYEHENTVVVEDSAGKEIEEIETIYYRQYHKSRFVRILVQYIIIDTETGRHLESQRFVEDITDETIWIAYQGSIYDLPENKRHYLDAPRDPRPTSILVDKLFESISRKIGRGIVKFYR